MDMNLEDRLLTSITLFKRIQMFYESKTDIDLKRLSPK